MLHSAGRLGFLSYLYEQRHAIAFAAGFIDSIPIAICSSNYDFNDTLEFKSGPHEEEVPATLFQGNEINLFIQHPYYPVSNLTELSRRQKFPDHTNRPYPEQAFAVFHPPTA